MYTIRELRDMARYVEQHHPDVAETIRQQHTPIVTDLTKIPLYLSKFCQHNHRNIEEYRTFNYNYSVGEERKIFYGAMLTLYKRKGLHKAIVQVLEAPSRQAVTVRFGEVRVRMKKDKGFIEKVNEFLKTIDEYRASQIPDTEQIC